VCRTVHKRYLQRSAVMYIDCPQTNESKGNEVTYVMHREQEYENMIWTTLQPAIDRMECV